MDCLTFRKNINAYLEDRLSDEELNIFLQHLESCESCREELEINFIVNEGISILDEGDQDYNLSQAYERSLKRRQRYIRSISVLRILSYAADTLAFWGVVFCAVIFLRIFFSL